MLNTLTLSEGGKVFESFNAVMVQPNSLLPPNTIVKLAEIPLAISNIKNLVYLTISIGWKAITPNDSVSLKFRIYRQKIDSDSLIYTTVHSVSNPTAFYGETTSFIHIDVPSSYISLDDINNSIVYILTVEVKKIQI